MKYLAVHSEPLSNLTFTWTVYDVIFFERVQLYRLRRFLLILIYNSVQGMRKLGLVHMLEGGHDIV